MKFPTTGPSIKWSRNRFQTGGGKTLSPQWSLEVYYVRQKDDASRPNDLSGFGLMLTVRL